jgi:hypothetical protein
MFGVANQLTYKHFNNSPVHIWLHPNTKAGPLNYSEHNNSYCYENQQLKKSSQRYPQITYCEPYVCVPTRIGYYSIIFETIQF